MKDVFTKGYGLYVICIAVGLIFIAGIDELIRTLYKRSQTKERKQTTMKKFCFKEGKYELNNMEGVGEIEYIKTEMTRMNENLNELRIGGRENENITKEMIRLNESMNEIKVLMLNMNKLLSGIKKY